MNKVSETIGLTCLGAGTFPLDNLQEKIGKSTTILDIIHKTGRDGMPKTAYMAHSPRGGRFVNHRFWTLKQAQELFDSLEEVPDVFFSDRCAPGNILLAQLFHEREVQVTGRPRLSSMRWGITTC